MSYTILEEKTFGLPGCAWVFIIPVLFIVLYTFGGMLWNNCGEIDKDELLIEEMELANKSKIYIVHSWKCHEKCYDRKTRHHKMQWFENIEKISDFIKYKFYVYDFCIDKVHANALNAISNANIEDLEREYDLDLKHRDFYDTSNRYRSIYYSLGKRDSLIALPEGCNDISDYKEYTFFKGE